MPVPQSSSCSSIHGSGLPGLFAEALSGLAAVYHEPLAAAPSATVFEEAERCVRGSVNALSCEVLVAWIKGLDGGALRVGRTGQRRFRVAVTPEHVPPGDLQAGALSQGVSRRLLVSVEWLPTVWGGENGFAEIDEADEIAAAVLNHYNRVARELAEEPEAYAPVMEVDRADGELLWGPWINGFERAMRLRADAWDAVAFGDDEEAAASVGTILAMNAFDQGESELTEEEEDEIDRTEPDLIHSMVRHLTARKSARPLHRIGPGDIAFDEPPAHGRHAVSDEPYLCGSGRTYGRCCGAH